MSKQNRIDPGTIMGIASVSIGVLSGLEGKGWREGISRDLLNQANRIGVKLNAKKEELIMSFEKAYSDLASRHNLEQINFREISSKKLNDVVNTFNKYGETQLVEKYNNLALQYNDYYKKNKTVLESTISKISGGKVTSLSSLANIHNNKIDDMVASWSADFDKHNSDIKDKMDLSKQKDSIDLDNAKQSIKDNLSNKVVKAENDMLTKQQLEQDKLQSQKKEKYDTLSKAVNDANDWIQKIQHKAPSNTTKWYHNVAAWFDPIGDRMAKRDWYMQMDADRRNMNQGLKLDTEFDISPIKNDNDKSDN